MKEFKKRSLSQKLLQDFLNFCKDESEQFEDEFYVEFNSNFLEEVFAEKTLHKIFKNQTLLTFAKNLNSSLEDEELAIVNTKAVLKTNFRELVYYSKDKNLTKLFETYEATTINSSALEEKTEISAKKTSSEETKEKKTTKKSGQYVVGVAHKSTIDDDYKVTDTELFVGSKKDILLWLNEKIVKFEIKSPKDKQLIIHISTEEMSQPALSESWNTLDELIEKGVVEI